MIQGLKNILLSVIEEGESDSSAALGFGLALANEAGAHLTLQVASVRFEVPTSVSSEVAEAIFEEENRRLRARGEMLALRAQQEATSFGVSCSIKTPQLTYDDLRESLIGLARVHDLCIFDAEKGVLSTRSGLIHSVLFESGRPILIVPPNRGTFAASRIMVAWDGSAPAARAVGNGLPFFRAAEMVEVVSVLGEKDLSKSMPGAELASYLLHHDVNVEVKNCPVIAGDDVAATLRDQVGISRTDMIVMGGFANYSRWRQWVFGGVTQSLLESSPVPILMSH
jgi:nucleotide-binding universal stress UspA family protein